MTSTLNVKSIAVPILVLAALAGLAIWGARQQPAPAKAIAIACPDPVTGCAFLHNNQPAQLYFSEQPQTLKRFEIRLSHPTLKQASASFQMAGMNMGFNRYEFRPLSAGVWAASATLPMCTASRTDWIAELELDGRLYTLNFATLK